MMIYIRLRDAGSPRWELLIFAKAIKYFLRRFAIASHNWVPEPWNQIETESDWNWFES